MSQVPVPFNHNANRPMIPVPVRGTTMEAEAAELPLTLMWGIVRRHSLLIGTFGIVMLAAALAYSFLATPVYMAVGTLRINDKDKNQPDFFVGMASGGEVMTEVEVLRSRSLVEDATRLLGLQVLVQKPARVNRGELFSGISVEPGTMSGKYELRRTSDGRFDLVGPAGVPGQVGIGLGTPVDAGGLKFVLEPGAFRYPRVQFLVEPREETVLRIMAATTVSQSNREAKVVSLAYQDTDPQLVWQVPNLILERFITRRQDGQKAAARSTVAFLRPQLDTLAVQLNASEQALRDYREREQVVNPVVEGTTQVDRMIKLQAERSSVESERSALAQLLTEVQENAARAPEGRSPYRRLVSFPTLLRNQASTELLRNLAEVEDQRSQLLVRRTEADPEVKALEGRIHDIEDQLHATASTYLQGLTNQVGSMDSEIGRFSVQLSRVPKRELDFDRLQRQPKVLEDMYALLQTRLKEAEIAQAVEDPSVQIVDKAVAPVEPMSPRKRIIIPCGLVLGLLLGVGVAFLVEYLDKSVHTRSDITGATGLPVLGLIPKIPRPGKRVALISERRATKGDRDDQSRVARRTWPPRRVAIPAATPAPAPGNRTYTYLPGSDPTLPAEPEVTSAEQPTSVPTPFIPRRDQRMTITGIGTAIAEAYGSLQTSLLHSRLDRPIQTVVFTSSQPGEGKTTSAVNLALSLTHRGANVLLIDADLRRGTVHEVFEVPREPGFAEVIRGTVPFEHACRTIRVDDGGVLHYLTTGALPRNPSGVLASSEMRSLLETFRGRFEMIILDSPPVNMMTDAALLGACSDGVVIVARAGVTHSAALAYTMEQLGHVRAQVLGVVLNDIDFRRDATYDAAYRYYDYGQHAKSVG